MKLTKEECNYAYTMIDNYRCYVECEKCNYKYTCNLCRSRNIIKQLINEHFESSASRVESSLTRKNNLVINLVSEIDKLEKQVDKLEKALDKACELAEIKKEHLFDD